MKDAIKQIVGDCYGSDNRHVTVIIYNHAAKVGQFTQQNYKEVGMMRVHFIVYSSRQMYDFKYRILPFFVLSLFKFLFQIIDALKCSGMTSFSAAFDAVSGSLTNFVGCKSIVNYLVFAC